MSYEAYRRILAPPVRALYRVEVRGEEHVPPAGPLIVTGNHDSVLDPFVMAVAVARPMHWIGKSEFWRVPILRSWLHSIGAIPVERGGSDVAAIESAIAALRNGDVVAIFPEGGVKREGPWQRGAARMALATGSPLLPVRLLDTRKAIGLRSVGFPRVAALIGKPIGVERAEPTGEIARELTDRLQAAVEALGT